MQVVAGISLSGIKPRVWDSECEYYLRELQAVMVSYADFHRMPTRRRWAMEQGIHEYLGTPEGVKVYLDNGAFYFLSRDGEMPVKDYEEFVEKSNPDWFPIPQDFIPTPKMSRYGQKKCFLRTMEMNRNYQHGYYIPVIHVSKFLGKYVEQIKKEKLFLNGEVLGNCRAYLTNITRYFMY